jgi:hypothetical protein
MDGKVRELIKVPRDQQGVLLIADNGTRVLRKGKVDVSAPPLMCVMSRPT